jgi:hypothetical protein
MADFEYPVYKGPQFDSPNGDTGSFVQETLKAVPRTFGAMVEESGRIAHALTAGKFHGASQLIQTGKEAQEKHAMSPEFVQAHPIAATVGGAVEGLATMAPYLAGEAFVSAIAPEAGLPAAAGTLARGFSAVARGLKKTQAITRVGLPAGIGLATADKTYEMAREQGKDVHDSVAASILPGVVSAAGMALMGPGAKAGRSLLFKESAQTLAQPAKKEFVKDIIGGMVVDTPIMQGAAAATALAQSAAGVKPEQTATEILTNPQQWLSATITGGIFGVLNAAHRKGAADVLNEALSNPEMNKESRAKAVEMIYQRGKGGNETTAELWRAQALDLINKKQPIPVDAVEMFKAPEEPVETGTPEKARTEVLKAVQESVATGGEKTPLEIMAENKETEGAAVSLEALKPDSYMMLNPQTGEVERIPNTAESLKMAKEMGYVSASDEMVAGIQEYEALRGVDYEREEVQLSRTGEGVQGEGAYRDNEKEPVAGTGDSAIQSQGKVEPLKDNEARYVSGAEGREAIRRVGDTVEWWGQDANGDASIIAVADILPNGRLTIREAETPEAALRAVDLLARETGLKPDETRFARMKPITDRMMEEEKILRPAVRFAPEGGKEMVTTAEPGTGTHYEALAKIPRDFENRHGKLQGSMKEGYVLPDGTFLSRREIIPWLRINDPETYRAIPGSMRTAPEGLESVSYNRAKGLVGNDFEFIDGLRFSRSEGAMNSDVTKLYDLLRRFNPEVDWKEKGIKAGLEELRKTKDEKFSREIQKTETLFTTIETGITEVSKGLKIPVEVVRSRSEIPGLKQPGFDFSGVYHEGKIWMVADQLKDLDHAKEILLKHELIHAGFRESLGKDFDTLLGRAWSSRGTEVREFADKVGIDWKTKAGKAEATEEWLVEFAKTDAKSPVWDKFVSVLKDWVRKVFGIDLKLSDAEIRNLVAEAGKAMKGDKKSLTPLKEFQGTYPFAKFDEMFADLAPTRFNSEGKPVIWYSKLEKHLDDKTRSLKGDKPVPVSHFEQLLKDTSLKKDELEQSGVREWLAGKEKATKNEVMDYLKENQVELKDVVLGGANTGWNEIEQDLHDTGEARLSNGYTVVYESGAYEIYDDGNGFQGTAGYSVADAVAYLKKAYPGYASTTPTHFSQYTEPGAKEGSYREMFVTVPVSPRDQAAMEHNAKISADHNAPTKILQDSWKDGHSQYSDIQNPVVRIRFNERFVADSEGTSVEVGGKGGKVQRLTHERQKMLDAGMSDMGVRGNRILFVEEMQGPSDENQGKMPEYLKNRIYDIGVKRILRYAKENGFDGVAWTPGEVQAKRYDLSKHFDKIEALANPDGTFNIFGYNNAGERIVDKLDVPQGQLPDVVGKELAEKIVKQPWVRGEYKGLDLKVGGEGLKRLYDQMLPKMFEKYGGEKVGETRIESPNAGRPPANVVEDYTREHYGVAFNNLRPEQRAELYQEVVDAEKLKALSTPFIPITEKTPGSYPLFARVAQETPPAERREATNEWTKGIFTAGRVIKDAASSVYSAVMPIDRTITLATSRNDFAPVRPNFNEILRLRREKAQYVPTELYKAHENIKMFSKAGMDGVSDVAYKATLYELDPFAPMERQWVDAENWSPVSGVELAPARSLEEAKADLMKSFNRLTPEQKQTYKDMTDHISEARQQRFRALLRNVDLAFGPGTEKAMEEKAKLMNDFAQMTRGRYVPLSRFGQFLVRTFAIEGDEKGRRLHTKAYESKQGALDAVAEARNQNLHAEITEKMDPKDYVVNVPSSFLASLTQAAEARGISGEQLEQLTGDITRLWVSTMAPDTIKGNSLHRQAVEGFSTDLARTYAAHIQREAMSTSNALYNPLIAQQFRNMKTVVSALKEDVENPYDPNALIDIARLADKIEAQDIRFQRERISEATKAISKITYLHYLTSPSVWAVQWSQPFMMTIPKMAGKYGFAEAMGYYTRAASQYMRGAFSDQKIAEFEARTNGAGRRMLQALDQARNGSKVGLGKAQAIYDGMKTEADRNLLIQATLLNQGGITLSLSHDVMDQITSGRNIEKMLDTATEYGSFFMRKSEMGSRKAAAVAAFRVALEKGGKNMLEANDYALHVIDDTLYDFSSENRPALLKGNVGRVIGQFQFFRLHTVGKVMQLVMDSAKRGYESNVAAFGESKAKEMLRESRKELAFMTGMGFALAGAAGTPISMLASNLVTDALWAGIKFLFDDPDDPWNPKQDFEATVRESLGDTAGTAVLKGLPAMMGLDISRRVGMGGMANMIQNDPPPGMSEMDKANWLAGRILGPSWGVATDVVRAFDAVGRGELADAFMYSNPKIVKDFIKTYNLNAEGVVAKGKTILQPEDVSPWSFALQFAGINPTQVALAREEAAEINKLSYALSARRTKLLKDFTEARLNDDYEAEEKAIEKINAWAEKQPKLMISQKELVHAVRRAMKLKEGAPTKREEIIKEQLS